MTYKGALRLSRKEFKLLDPGVPWGQLIHVPKEAYAHFVMATAHKYNNWTLWFAVWLRHNNSETGVQREVRSNCNKICGVSVVRAKSHTVAVGCAHPQLAELVLCSPTMFRLAFFFLPQIYACGLVSGRQLLVADMEATYLQKLTHNKRTEELPIYLPPFRHPVARDAGAFFAKLQECSE